MKGRNREVREGEGRENWPKKGYLGPPPPGVVGCITGNVTNGFTVTVITLVMIMREKAPEPESEKLFVDAAQSATTKITTHDEAQDHPASVQYGCDQ